jgi:hypothetical protein
VVIWLDGWLVVPLLAFPITALCLRQVKARFREHRRMYRCHNAPALFNRNSGGLRFLAGESGESESGSINGITARSPAWIFLHALGPLPPWFLQHLPAWPPSWPVSIIIAGSRVRRKSAFPGGLPHVVARPLGPQICCIDYSSAGAPGP